MRSAHPCTLPASAEAGQQPGHVHEVQHPPQIVRQDRQAELCAHLGQATPQEIALIPAPFHCPKGMLYELFARFPEVRLGVYMLLHLFEQMLVYLACDPPAPLIARALGLERAGATSRGRLVANVAPKLDGVEAKAEHLAGWTTIRVHGCLISEIVFAE